MPGQGQVRCPVDSMQATCAADAGPEVPSCLHHSLEAGMQQSTHATRVVQALHSPCRVSFDEAVEPCRSHLDHHTLCRPVGHEWSKDPSISNGIGFNDMHRPGHCCPFHCVSSFHSAFGEAAGQVWSKDPSISDSGANGSTTTSSPCLSPRVGQAPVSEVQRCKVRGTSIAVAFAQCEDAEFIYFQQCSWAGEAQNGRAHDSNCFSGCLRICVECCSALWNGKPYAGMRVGEAAHPGPEGNGLEAILGPGLLESIKSAIQKLVAQAVRQSLGQAGLPAGNAKANKRRKRKVKKAAAKKGGAGGTQSQAPPTSAEPTLSAAKDKGKGKGKGQGKGKGKEQTQTPPSRQPASSVATIAEDGWHVVGKKLPKPEDFALRPQDWGSQLILFEDLASKFEAADAAKTFEAVVHCRASGAL